MSDINTLYYNDFGIAFQWKRCAVEDINRIQLVFRGTGLFFTKDELLEFSEKIEYSFNNYYYNYDCQFEHSPKPILLETPLKQVSLSVNKKELVQIKDLVKGVLFRLNFSQIINTILSQ